MSPLKNTDKHFSDYLPAALVKDWRQCFRSRSAFCIFILLELAAWLLLFCNMPAAEDTPEFYQIELQIVLHSLYAFGLFALAVAIPYRAGRTVAADTRVRSSNFLMLTPLSARRIVWGTWCSTALMVLLAALLALPLLGAYQVLASVAPGTTRIDLALVNTVAFGQHALVLGWLVLAGWVMTACFMFVAGLPRLLQLGVLAFILFLGAQASDGVAEIALLVVLGQVDNGMQLFSLLLCAVDAALFLVLFLELARRHYAAPAENGSLSVRLLALLPWLLLALLVGAVWLGVVPQQSEGLTEVLDSQAQFALIYLCFAWLADALLPTWSLPASACRPVRGLPRWFQKPGLVPSSLLLASTPLFYLLANEADLLLAHDMSSSQQISSLLVAATEALNFGFSLLLWLLITDCLCRRSAPKRPTVFALVVLACSFVAACLKLPLHGLHEWCSLLPLGGKSVPWLALLNSHALNQVLAACALNGGALLITLLLLLCWRGRVHKP